jgi:hypothetical protein
MAGRSGQSPADWPTAEVDRLYLTGTWDQALQAAVVEQARPVADLGGGRLDGRTLQQLLYFMTRCRVPTSYRFDVTHSGAYCWAAGSDVGWMVADRVLVDRRTSEADPSDYTAGPNIRLLSIPHASGLAVHAGTVGRVVQAMTPLTPDHLELIAMLDYLHRWFEASVERGPIRPRAVRRLLQIRGDRFSDSESEAAYDAMNRIGLWEEESE